MATRSSLLSAYTERLSRLTTVWATQDAASRETVLATESLASAPSQLFQVGTEVNGRYRIEALLGTGGMGRVYRVHDRLYPDRHTALKTLLTDTDDSQASLFRSEFQTMASLSHPGIARVYDFERLVGRNTFFFTMELVDGQAIAPRLEATRLAAHDYPVGLEFVIRPPLEAGPCPGSGRSNAHG